MYDLHIRLVLKVLAEHDLCLWRSSYVQCSDGLSRLHYRDVEEHSQPLHTRHVDQSPRQGLRGLALDTLDFRECYTCVVRGCTTSCTYPSTSAAGAMWAMPSSTFERLLELKSWSLKCCRKPSRSSNYVILYYIIYDMLQDFI